MTFQKILNDLTFNNITAKEAYAAISQRDKLKTINYYSHYENITSEPMKEGQLQELRAIVGILQILYDSTTGSPISDSDYDVLQEILVDMGIPRNTSSYEPSDLKKVSHTHTRLRGTLGKVYYLFPDEPRTNKSRKSLDDYLARITSVYEKATGKKIDFNQVQIILQPKFDGCAVNEENNDGKRVWITRGDTATNRATDVTKIMDIFNDVFPIEDGGAVKFEAMMPEGNLEKINEFYKAHPYSDSRQVVISIFTANEPDFKVDYLYPVPLRIIHPGDEIESIHPMMLEKFPTEICTFGDRDVIKRFANEHRYVDVNGVRLRTDGAVLTIIDPEICKVLGRENNINLYEIAYKFTEETATSRVKDVEFYVSEFGYITPVLVVNDVILKGKTINHISLSNKERFDELALCYGDEVRVHYDIIPYATVDSTCRRARNGRRIQFVTKCPCCKEELDLDVVEVQCRNPDCPSRLIGCVLNYCKCLRIKNIGYSTIDALYTVGLLDHGIRSLYKLKKHSHEIQDLDGFGKIRTRKMIGEIESKRRLKDYEFFGAIGIEDMATKTFKAIFQKIRLREFVDMVKLGNFDLMHARLVSVPGVGNKKAECIVRYLKLNEHRKDLMKLLQEVQLEETCGSVGATKGRIVFSGCRPSEDVETELRACGWESSDSWTSSTKYLVVPSDDYTSGKVDKANTRGVPVIALNGRPIMDILARRIPNLKD